MGIDCRDFSAVQEAAFLLERAHLSVSEHLGFPVAFPITPSVKTGT